MKPFKRAPKAVYVEWVDSSTTYGWQNPESDETSLIRSVALLVAKTARTITLSTSESQHGRMVDQISIPMSCVRKLRRIKT